MAPVLVDIVAFIALLVPFLWLTQRKGMSGGWAAWGASMWVFGGFVGLAAATVLDLEWALGAAVIGRILGAGSVAMLLWSRPDDLPRRVHEGQVQFCVYKSPGPFTAEQIAAFLLTQSITATYDAWAVWVAESDLPTARRSLPGFVAPRRLIGGSSPSDAHFKADWLRRHDVEATVRGDNRVSIQGAVPIPESFPDVWVRGADYDRAKILLDELDQIKGDGETWACPQCHEDNPPRFESCWSCEQVRPSAT